MTSAAAPVRPPQAEQESRNQADEDGATNPGYRQAAFITLLERCNRLNLGFEFGNACISGLDLLVECDRIALECVDRGRRFGESRARLLKFCSQRIAFGHCFCNDQLCGLVGN